MSSDVGSTNVWEASIIGPEDGDPRTAASVREGLGDLANRSLHLYEDGPLLTGTNKIRMAARSLTRCARTVKVSSNGGAPIDGQPASVALSIPTGAAARGLQALDLPQGATITAISVTISPAVDGVLPATTRAQVQLVSKVVSTGATSSTGLTHDPNASAGAYEVVHSFGPTGLAVVVDNTTTVYAIEMFGEVGANAQAYDWIGSRVTFTTATTMDDAAS